MFKLPELTYDYDALKDWVGEATMHAHHDHHHQTYVDKLNAAMENVSEGVREKYFTHEASDLAKFLTDVRAGKLDDKIDAKTRVQLINHGGGHYNHRLFWNCLTPKNDGQPTGILAKKLDEKYGSFANFATEFETAATGLFGSGWCWLTKDLDIATSANQDLTHDQILIGLDLWEHAYYLDYKWNRADYAKAWWAHVNWDFAAQNFAKN